MIYLLTEQETGWIIGVFTQTHAREPAFKRKSLESPTYMISEFRWSVF